MSIDFSNSLSPIKVEMRWYGSYLTDATLIWKKMKHTEKRGKRIAAKVKAGNKAVAEGPV